MANIGSYHDVLIRPLITEKSTRQIELGQYSFEVHRDANKIQIREAVEEIFDVKVLSVNTINRQGKRKRTKSGFGKRKDTKRAIVTLSADSKAIEIFGGPAA